MTVAKPSLPPFETRCLSSLAKVFADTELHDPSFNRGSALANETYSFQIAYRSSQLQRNLEVQLHCDPAIASRTLVRRVGLVPSELPAYPDHDEHVLRTTPGLYPDPLFPLAEGPPLMAMPQWRSIWVAIELDGSVPAGEYTLGVSFHGTGGELLGEESFVLAVVGVSLPKQRLLHTEWFHCDGLAQYYGVEVFSEPHWELIESYIATAAAHGMNMILTPLFTPPLDTAVGGERLTTQLVAVEAGADGTYAFDFSLVRRWIKLCQQYGIDYFELSHLFTQWGARHAPKIVGKQDGAITKLFGWETAATGEDYRNFLGQFLPALLTFIAEEGLESRCYFHVSDEPHLDHLEDYRQASAILEQYIGGYPRIDALSDYSFYEQGLVPTPIPSTDHIEPFLDNQVPGLWTYYCCGQYKEVSNRSFNFSSARNRIIGLQLYKFQITGFLHWGYNFWNSQFSLRPINPYQVTDADAAFISGDAYLVYPGSDGNPIESLRMEVFYEALQDLRAMELLESYIGREAVVSLIEQDLVEPLTFKQYPRDAAWLLKLRERINEQLRELSAEGTQL